MGRNNNSNKNIKLQIKSFLKKISLQLYFKRVPLLAIFSPHPKTEGLFTGYVNKP